jgi:uncharacterized cupin superfamily protein
MKRSGSISYQAVALPRLTVKRSKSVPGDFIAFPTPSVPHHLKNPFDQDLVYLMGGENREFEIADFLGLGKRMVKSGEKFEAYDMSNAKPFGPLG